LLYYLLQLCDLTRTTAKNRSKRVSETQERKEWDFGVQFVDLIERRFESVDCGRWEGQNNGGDESKKSKREEHTFAVNTFD
jgi:hypothetical protein